jgi:BASS family bile acid:Na+ symporter
MNAIFIVLPILTLLMFDLGLILKPQDFKLIVQRPKPVIVGLIGQIILLPLIAWGVIQLLFNNEIIAIPAIIYALMMNLILLAYVGITKIQKERL